MSVEDERVQTKEYLTIWTGPQNGFADVLNRYAARGWVFLKVLRTVETLNRGYTAVEYTVLLERDI